NDGNHYNDAINSGNNYYFSGDTARGNALADDLIIASDHLPLIADYQVPAALGWDWNPAANRVLVDANVLVDFEIRNDAPVVHALGADVLHVDVVATGDLSGSTSVSVAALAPPEIISLPIDTSVSGTWAAAVTLTSTSPETQTLPETVKLGGDIIEHANASFAYAEDLDWYTYDISFDENSGVQAFNVWLFNYGFDGSQSLLEIDDVTIPELPVVFNGLSTNTVGSIPALMEFEIDTDSVTPDTYTSFLPISFSDEDLVGEQNGISMLTVRIEITSATSCPEDFDGNGIVAVADILYLIAGWGGNDPVLDLDGNGTVGVSDILQLIAAWGPC
ncbi:MAG: hypothetical protein HOC27_08065, partial [Phycisphaerae bacterium]|nr:hypothetical protein [Phycisphaerae bacterium]